MGGNTGAARKRGRNVTVRELSRNARKVDEVESGSRLRVIRFGRPVALITPLPGAPVRAVALETPPEPAEPAVPDLTPLERELLIAMMPGGGFLIEDLPPLDTDVRERALAVTRLELKGLVTRHWDAYWITHEGAPVARALAAVTGEITSLPEPSEP